MVNLRKSYNNFVFDWDGTLAKTTEALIRAYKRAFIRRGLLITNRQLRYQIFGKWEDGIRRFAVPKYKKVFEEIVEEVNRDIKSPDLFEGVSNVLEKLYRRNKKLALVTLLTRDAVIPALKKHDIEKFFNVVVTGSEVMTKKPDPTLIIEAQKGLNVLFTDTVFIGNSVNDVEMGKKAKLTTGIFTPKENRDFFDYNQIVAAKPDFVFQDYDYVIRRFT